MNNLLLKINNHTHAIGSRLSKLTDDFNRNLLLIAEVCEVSDAFIFLDDNLNNAIEFKIGLDTISTANQITCLDVLLETKQDLIIADLKNDDCFLTIDCFNIFHFFAGFPIISELNDISGFICILGKIPKKLSRIELSVLKNSVSEIKSLLRQQHERETVIDDLHDIKKRLDIILENSKELFFQLNSDSKFTYISSNLINLLGYSENEILGVPFFNFLHPTEIVDYQIYFSNAFEIKIKKNEYECRLLHKNGSYIWHNLSLSIVQNDEEFIVFGVAREVSKYLETRNKLQEQKDFYETILNQLPTDVAVFDLSGKYIFVNPIAIKNDHLREYIIGKDDFEYAAYTNRGNETALERRAKFNIAIKSKKTHAWDEVLHTPNQETTHHSRKITPVLDENGNIKMLIGFSVDMTESTKAQNEILKRKQLIKNILENVAVGILVQGPDSEIIDNNNAACEMLGLTQEQLLGKTSFDPHWSVIYENGSIFKSENHPAVEAVKTLKPVNNVIMGVNRPNKKDLIWLLVDAIPFLNELQELQYVIISFSDITAQKNTEKQLKASNERFDYATQATSDAIWDWDVMHKKLYFGGSYYTLFGHQFENNTISISESEKFIHPEDKVAFLDSIVEAIYGTSNKWSAEYRYLKSDGTYADVRDKAIIIRDENGNTKRMIGAIQDISLEKRLRDELKQSEEQFKGAFKYSNIGIAIVDVHGNWKVTNNRLQEFLGYSFSELNTMTLSELTYPDDVEANLVNLNLMKAGSISSYSIENRYIHKNQSIIWAHASVSLVKDNKGNPNQFIFQIIDITSKKKVEQENKLLEEENYRNKAIQLNEAKNMYRLLADNMVDLVCVHDLNTNFQYVSPSIESILGYKPEDLNGMSPFDFIHPEDVDNLKQSVCKLLSNTGGISSKNRFRHSNGNYIWCEIRANLVKENGIPTSFHTSTRDITQNMEAEFAINKALIQERELNELRTNLVSTISHEFRTPMTTIRASAELVMMYLDDQKLKNYDLLHKRINIIISEIDRIVELMNTVLIISKNDLGKTNFSPTNFDLMQTCLDVIELSSFDKNENRKVKTYFKGNSFPVFADRKLMEYTIFNIISNAFKYSKGSNSEVLLNLFTIEKEVIVEIIDFGIGIPQDEQLKLFNTFFRASNTYGIQGTGLGLYIVKTFTERNSGSIEIESELGKGTKVTLKFQKSEMLFNAPPELTLKTAQ